MIKGRSDYKGGHDGTEEQHRRGGQPADRSAGLGRDLVSLSGVAVSRAGRRIRFVDHLSIAFAAGCYLFRKRGKQLRTAPWLLAAIAVSAGFCNVGYVLAMLYGEVVRVMLLFYLAPLWTLLFAWLLLGEV